MRSKRSSLETLRYTVEQLGRDVETELARLDSQRENLLKRIEGAQKKLSNENFVSRAPADIVAKERERLAELENQLALVDENIAQLRA